VLKSVLQEAADLTPFPTIIADTTRPELKVLHTNDAYMKFQGIDIVGTPGFKMDTSKGDKKMTQNQRTGLRIAHATGAPYVTVFESVKASGKMYQKVIAFRGYGCVGSAGPWYNVCMMQPAEGEQHSPAYRAVVWYHEFELNVARILKREEATKSVAPVCDGRDTSFEWPPLPAWHTEIWGPSYVWQGGVSKRGKINLKEVVTSSPYACTIADPSMPPFAQISGESEAFQAMMGSGKLQDGEEYVSALFPFEANWDGIPVEKQQELRFACAKGSLAQFEGTCKSRSGEALQIRALMQGILVGTEPDPVEVTGPVWYVLAVYGTNDTSFGELGCRMQDLANRVRSAFCDGCVLIV